ncbi:DUF4233 domain-containing protein [Herbiconiux daphne]|uniref:DUF4233 domain-containing protein n=1 Tax=Herbiconiux daphne TaxID=2970914 RepID=A0ABT2H0X3_9MICO|nr:DUF4233 domain-containing protein [Herbiconiux daphne]MCS5733579.1 DUF4233 domain-containing protein [Herbiconiux daphne]
MRGGSVRQSLGAIVLGFESIVMFFAALVIFGLKALPAPVALIGGAALCVLLIATAALLRFRWGYALGWVLQAVIVAACFLVPLLSIVAAIFIGLWVYCMVKGASIDRQNAAAAASAQAHEPPAATS